MGCFAGPNILEDGLVLALDGGNKKSFSPNVFPRGTDIYGWYVDTKGNATASNCTVSRDTIHSPVGKTPLKMEITGNDPYLYSYNTATWNLATASSGDTWTVSFYVKASQSTTGEILLFGSSGTAYYEIPNVTYNITTSWQRVTYTGTFSNASTQYIQLRLDGTHSGGSGITIWWDGLQLERGSTATEFTDEYTLDSSLNERMLDLSGQGNDGTIGNNPVYDANDSGSLSFDGSNDYISFASASELQFLNRSPYTLEVWMYPTVNPGDSTWTGIFNRESNAGSGRDGYNLFLEGTSGTNLELSTQRFFSGSNNTNTRVYSESDLLNKWSHIVVTYNGTNLTMYRNGSLAAPSTSTGNITNTSKALEIGRRGTASYFTGRLTGQKIYNRALSLSEIQQNFNALRGRYGL